MADTIFNYLSAEKSPLYRAIMGAFSEAETHFVVHLRPEDVVERGESAHDLEQIQSALEQLVQWGNLQAKPDTSRVTTVEDFYRARYLYQITRKGEAALATYTPPIRVTAIGPRVPATVPAICRSASAVTPCCAWPWRNYPVARGKPRWGASAKR